MDQGSRRDSPCSRREGVGGTANALGPIGLHPSSSTPTPLVKLAIDAECRCPCPLPFLALGTGPMSGRAESGTCEGVGSGERKAMLSYSSAPDEAPSLSPSVSPSRFKRRPRPLCPREWPKLRALRAGTSRSYSSCFERELDATDPGPAVAFAPRSSSGRKR